MSKGKNDARVGANISRNLKALRGKLGLSQRELDRISGVSSTTIANIEQGETEPYAGNLVKLAAALGVSVDQLVSDEVPEPQFSYGAFVAQLEALFADDSPDTARQFAEDFEKVAQHAPNLRDYIIRAVRVAAMEVEARESVSQKEHRNGIESSGGEKREANLSGKEG